MKTRIGLFGFLLAWACSTTSSFGATNTWISGNGFWAFTDSWVEAVEPTASDDVFFDSLVNGAGGWVRLNGGPAGLPFRSARSLTFLEGVGTYLIDGNTGGEKKELLIGEGGVLNASTNLQILNAQVFISASQVWDAEAGDIVAEDIVQLGTNSLTVTGANDVTLNGVISGSGDLIKDGSGTLTLGAPNTYTGDTILNSGTLTYAVDQTLTGGLVLNGGLLDANDQSLSFGTLTLGGDSTLLLGFDTISQSVSFTDSLWSGGTLNILSWGSGLESDQVLLLNEPSQDLLDNIIFDGFAPGALWEDGLLLPIPEPSATLLAALGAVGFLVTRFCRRHGSSDPS
jgi:autotransporter-associated beta strand protein